MRIEFRVLGRLTVAAADRPVAIPGLKPRQLLTALLLSANEPVSIDRLMDALWPAGPPKSAHDNLLTYGSAVRRALGLGDPPAATLTRSRTGFMLTVPADSLDLIAFTCRMTTARTALENRQVELAALHIDEALRLWCGPAGEGVPRDGWLGNALWALDEQRLLALEERGEAWLRLGRHAELVPQLLRSVAEHPWRERLWRQLMVAQYRCGATGDALITYRRARQIYAEELGIDPSAELTEVYQAILHRDDVPTVPGVPPTFFAQWQSDPTPATAPERPHHTYGWATVSRSSSF